MGSDSVVRIAKQNGLDNPGIKFRWGARSYAPTHTGPCVHPASCTTATGSFPVVQRSGGDEDQPYPSNVEVKDRVKLYVHSPTGPSCPVLA